MIIIVLSCTTTVNAEPADASKVAFTEFLQAFSRADTEAMAKLYAADVTIKQGSTLLKKEYGGLGGDDGNQKDKLVKRADLLEAFKTAIKKRGGKAAWTKVCNHLLLNWQIVYVDHETKVQIESGLNAKHIFQAFGAQRSDVIGIVNPGGDKFIFHFREIDGAWKVIGEYWN